jgi:hypothetical protein
MELRRIAFLLRKRCHIRRVEPVKPRRRQIPLIAAKERKPVLRRPRLRKKALPILRFAAARQWGRLLFRPGEAKTRFAFAPAAGKWAR